MLIAKGYTVLFVLSSGRTAKPAASYGLLHDPSGRDWPACSGLVAPFSKGGDEVENSEARKYFGHTAREGKAVLPPRSLSAWTKVGVVDEVLYTRTRPGHLPASHRGTYYHPIEKGTATLYRRGRLYRVELGRGCVWNERGVVRP
jgi:hypothetical protein